MKSWLFLASSPLSCTAACVWLRDTSNNGGLAWCVDSSTNEEGFFKYNFNDDIADLTPLQLHKKINRQYTKQAMRGSNSPKNGAPVLLSSLQAESQNWTMSTRELFGTVLDGGLTAVSDASDKLVDTIADQIEKLLGITDAHLPYTECTVKEEKHCVHRVEYNCFSMSQEQIFAIDHECKTTCGKLGKHCILNSQRLGESILERRCCACAMGDAHYFEDDESAEWTPVQDVDWDLVGV